MAWDPLNSTEIQPGKVGKTGLFGKIKSCLEYLYGLIGGEGGIIGLKNGSFENESGSPDYHPTNWNIEIETDGGEATVVSTNSAARGAKVLKLNLPGGGGNSQVQIRSDKFMVQANRPAMVRCKALGSQISLLYLIVNFFKADQTSSAETPVSLLPYAWPPVNSSGAGFIIFDPTGSPLVPLEGTMVEIQAALTVPSDACWCSVALYALGQNGYWFLDDVDFLQDTDLLQWATVGDVLLQSADTERYTASKTYVKAKSIHIYVSGKYRVKFDLRGTAGLNNAYGRIYRNGVAYGTERLDTDGAYTTYSEDLYFARGDTVDLYYKADEYTTYAYVQNFRLYYGVYVDFDTPPRLLLD
jgi:hypothetical protein